MQTKERDREREREGGGERERERVTEWENDRGQLSPGTIGEGLIQQTSRSRENSDALCCEVDEAAARVSDKVLHREFSGGIGAGLRYS